MVICGRCVNGSFEMKICSSPWFDLVPLALETVFMYLTEYRDWIRLTFYLGLSFFFVVSAVRSKSTVYVKPETYLYETIEPLLRGRFFGEWFLGNSAWLTCLVSWECYDWLRFPLVIRRAMLLAELNCWKLSIVYLRNRFEQFVFVWFYVTLVTHGSAEGCFGDISV